MLYDPDSFETRKLTRELDRLNRKIERLRNKSFENAPDFAQSTPFNQTTRPRRSDSGIVTARTPNLDFGTGSNIIQSSNVGKGAELDRSLEERYSPANQTELYRTQLRERRQKVSESLPELGQDIRRLANLSYPTAPNDVRETLVKEQFIDGLMSGDMRLRLKQARPSDLNDVIRHAVELEAFDKAEIKQNGKGYLRAITRDGDNSDIKDKTIKLLKNMQTALSGLQEEVKALKQTQEHFKNHKNRGCFNCGKF
ncbi:Hypothetical predicted protein [Mytilus galloprovincialis]|uniref:Uncharacterized protein n=1 Tax=Mytilus galloprovincialis TaxID=29158 RepID=A0A8B6FLW6_MYTGA|nr:Hypothetical predicted protein [Mytilus galloprovincialis]